MKQAIIYVLRHGQKQSGVSNEEAQLTEEGREQVSLVGETYLSGVNIALLFSSEMDRASEAAAIAYMHSEDSSTGARTPERRYELGFDGLPIDEYAMFAARATEYAESDAIMTLIDIKETMPVYVNLARERFRPAMQQVAVELAAAKCPEDFVALVGCHSPLSEILAFDPETPALGEAGLMKYTYWVSGDHATLVGSECMFSGF